MSEDPSVVDAGAPERERQVIIFGVAIIVAFVLAVALPDLVPTAARAGAAVFSHARVVTVTAAAVPGAPPEDASFPPEDASFPPEDASFPPEDASFPPEEGPIVDGGGAGGPGEGLSTAVVRLLDGPLAGTDGEALVQGPSGSLELPDYRPGDDVVVEVDTAPDGSQTLTVVDRWRMPLFGAVIGIVTVLAAALAGWRGLRAVASLALTLVLTVRLFVPLVILGWNPAALAIVFGAGVTVLTFMLTQGLNRTTVSAILGTFMGLAVTGVTAIIVTALAAFTPAQGSDEVVYLSQATNGSIDLSGLLLAAVIFGGLGVLNDVSISQAATVEELHRADPYLGRLELFARTMNVGTAHLAATINTLVFAYLGTALPLVVLLALEASNAGAAISTEAVAVEVTRILVGTVGILAAVPLTTMVAVRAVSPRRPRSRPIAADGTDAGRPMARPAEPGT